MASSSVERDVSFTVWSAYANDACPTAGTQRVNAKISENPCVHYPAGRSGCAFVVACGKCEAQNAGRAKDTMNDSRSRRATGELQLIYSKIDKQLLFCGCMCMCWSKKGWNLSDYSLAVTSRQLLMPELLLLSPTLLLWLIGGELIGI